MDGPSCVAILCVAALQAVAVIVAVRYGARKALAKVAANTALIGERLERIEQHLDIHPDDEPAIDSSVEIADRSGFFAPNPSEGNDCG